MMKSVVIASLALTTVLIIAIFFYFEQKKSFIDYLAREEVRFACMRLDHTIVNCGVFFNADLTKKRERVKR